MAGVWVDQGLLLHAGREFVLGGVVVGVDQGLLQHDARREGEIREKMKICTWNSGSHLFGSKIQF